MGVAAGRGRGGRTRARGPGAGHGIVADGHNTDDAPTNAHPANATLPLTHPPPPNQNIIVINDLKQTGTHVHLTPPSAAATSPPAEPATAGTDKVCRRPKRRSPATPVTTPIWSNPPRPDEAAPTTQRLMSSMRYSMR